MHGYLVVGSLLWGNARAGVICEDGSRHDTIADALATVQCTDLRLESGVFREEVVLTRAVRIQGAGPEKTWIACDDGPCLTVLPGNDLHISDLTLASGGTVLAAWFATVRLERAAVTPIESGGLIRLQNTDAWFVDVDVDVAGGQSIAVEAISWWGHDLKIERARFHGISARSGAASAIYNAAVGVACERCSFHPERSQHRPPQPLLELEANLQSPSDGERAEARWPQLHCASPTSADEATCKSQCAATDELALCRMTWASQEETCKPVAVCVPPGEGMPTLEPIPKRSPARPRPRG